MYPNSVSYSQSLTLVEWLHIEYVFDSDAFHWCQMYEELIARIKAWSDVMTDASTISLEPATHANNPIERNFVDNDKWRVWLYMDITITIVWISSARQQWPIITIVIIYRTKIIWSQYRLSSQVNYVCKMKPRKNYWSHHQLLSFFTLSFITK